MFFIPQNSTSFSINVSLAGFQSPVVLQCQDSEEHFARKNQAVFYFLRGSEILDNTVPVTQWESAAGQCCVISSLISQSHSSGCPWDKFTLGGESGRDSTAPMGVTGFQRGQEDSCLSQLPARCQEPSLPWAPQFEPLAPLPAPWGWIYPPESHAAPKRALRL